MSDTNVDYGALVSDTFENFKSADNLVPLVVGGLIVGFGGMLTLGILMAPLLLGHVMMTLRIARGETVAIGDIGAGFQYFVPALVLGILYGLAVSVGFMLIIVPGIIAMFLFSLSFFVLADDPTVGAVEALKASVTLVKDNFVHVLIVLLIAGVLNSIASALGGIGTLLTVPFGLLLMTKLYLKLTAGGGQAATPSAL